MTSSTNIALTLLVLTLHCSAAVVNQPSRQKLQQQQGKPRQSFACEKNEFSCGNGQCIPSSAVCNGLNDCQSGADECDEQCTVIETGVCTGRKRTKNICDDIADRAPVIAEKSNITRQFLCNSDVLNKDNSLSLVCVNHVWTPPATHCARICEPLTLSTSNATCFLNGVKVDCRKPLIAGTKVYPQCEFYYRPTVEEIVCRENGEWSAKTVQCTPACGRQFKERMRYTREMRSAEFREFPWTVAIYYTKPGTTIPILFPGTIISPYLIVTTAINLYADYQRNILTTDSVNVVVAKRTKELEAMDDQFQKTYKVQAIYFTGKGFQNAETSSSSENIALIELDEKLVLSPSVYPACVNWEKNETLYAKDGDIGQVPHTLTLHDANAEATTQHEILQTVALRFVGRDQCLNTESMKSVPHVVRTDNFCGEPISAPAPCDGAFVFLETNTNRFYVQGLVDGITPSADVPPLFTNTFVDLSVHVDWMKAIRKVNEDRLVSNEIRLEVAGTNSSTICAKKNDDSHSDPDLDVRFSSGKERRSEMDARDTESLDECLLPTKASLNANNYSISCPVNNENNACRRIKENTNVPQYTSVKIGCKQGFSMNTSNEEAICFKGHWNPVLTPCARQCDKLPKFDDGNFTCYQQDQRVKCTDGLSVGSRIVPQCNAPYKTDGRNTEHNELVCQEDGKWNGTLPQCGKKAAKDTPSSKSNRPQNRPQNTSPPANDGQPSLQPRSPSFAPSDSKNANRKPLNSTKVDTQAKTNSRDSYQPERPMVSRRGQSPDRSQTEVQSRAGFSPQGSQENNDPKSSVRGNTDQASQRKTDDINKSDDNEDSECSKNEFACGKLCISLSAMCNGTAECEDGTDENAESCKILNTDSCTPKSDAPNYCDNRTASNVDSKSGLSNEKHAFLCNAKYMANDNNEGIPLNCVNGVSTPATIPCIRVCKNVTVFASGLDCYRNGLPVDCKKPLLSGSKVVPRCESEYVPNFNGSTCNEKGEWDHPVIECIPECGKPVKKQNKMTKHIRPAQFREFPWNVAIYKTSKNTNTSTLFAGILIAPSLVLTNAHCCAGEMTKSNVDMGMFEVVIAKRSSILDTEDDDLQKTIKVKAVHLLDNANPNSESLAILELAEKITSNPAVQPACVNWYKNETMAPKVDAVGLIPHWRTRDPTNSDTIHEILQAVAVTMYNRETCEKRVPKASAKFLLKDAFCVDSIPMISPAHRGAGFIYQDGASKLNFVQGIAYYTGTQQGPITTFTNMFLNVSAHVDWMNSVRRKTEKRVHREWVLNNRVVGSDDVCKSQNVTNNNENDDSLNGLSSRSAFSADNEPDDFTLNGCELPDKTWLYLDYNVSCLPSRREKECKQPDAGGVVPEFASLTLSCNDGYVTNGSREVVCFRKNWSPAIEPCRKICDKLELANVTLKCFWEDKKIDCEDELKSGTTAIVECAPYYQSEKSLPKLHCDEYGHWKGASEVACSYFNPWEEKGEYFKYTMQI